MQTDLTVVVPSNSTGISMASARAYEHLVACELVRPCVWVEESETRELMGSLIGVQEPSTGTSDESQWWGPEKLPLLELVARVDPARIRLVALVLPGDRPPSDSSGWQDMDLPGRASRAFEHYRSDLQELSQYAMFVATVDSVAGYEVEPSLDPALLRDQPWLNVLVAPEDRADDSAMAVPVACARPLPFHIASSIASLTATWHGMQEDPLEAWADPPLTVPTASRSKLIIMRSRSRSLTVPSTADSVPASVLAKRVNWPVPKSCVAADSPMFIIEHLADAYLEGPGSALQFHAAQEVTIQTWKALKWPDLVKRIFAWFRQDLPKQIERDVRAKINGVGDRVDDWMTRKILGPDSEFRVDRRGRDLIVDTAEDGSPVDVFDLLEQLGGLELMSRRPPANADVWREFVGWSFAIIDGDRLPEAVEAKLSDGSSRQVVTDPKLIAPRSDDDGWWSPSQRIANFLGPSAVRMRPCDSRMARRNLQYLDDVVLWIDAVAAAQAAGSGDSSEEEPIKPSRWRIVRWWRTKRAKWRRRRAVRKAARAAKKAAKKASAKRLSVTSTAPPPPASAIVPAEVPVGRPVAEETEVQRPEPTTPKPAEVSPEVETTTPEVVVEADSPTAPAEPDAPENEEEPKDSADTSSDGTPPIPPPPNATQPESKSQGTQYMTASEETGIPVASGEVEIDTSPPTREEIDAARKSLREAIDARSGSFVWRIGSRLDRAMDESLAKFDAYAKELDHAAKNPPRIEADEDKKRSRRLKWSFFRGGLFILLAILGIVFLPLALILLIPIAGFLLLSALVSVIKGIFRYFRDRFQKTFERQQAISRIEFVRSEIGNVVMEMTRLHSNYSQYLDWSESVGSMVHRPFGPPLRYEGRTHGNWVGGLHAHQVGEGDIGSNTEIALVNSQSAEVFHTGWLNEVWGEAETEVADKFRLLTAANDLEADPYSDRSSGSTIDPIRDRSSRRFLLQMIEQGEPLSGIRKARMEEILTRLALLSPDLLCDSVEGREPATWLLDSVPIAGSAAAFPQSLWTTDGLMSLPTVERRTVWTPASLGSVESANANIVAMAPNTGTLASTVVCVDLSSVIDVAQPDAVLSVFGKDANPPIDRVPVPSVVRLGSVREIIGFDGDGPDISHLPQLGDPIAPRRLPSRPATGGSYRFMFLVDGRPCRYPADRPIDFHVRVGVGPSEGFQLVRDALQIMSDASGITFRFAGTFIDLEERRPDDGGLWISYVEPEDFGGSGSFGLGDGVLGHGGVHVAGETVLGGVVVIANDPGVSPGFGPGHTLGGVLLHEIGHALNLAHVDVQSELMFPYASEFTPETLGDGDRLGLWLLGAGRGRQ